MVQLAHELNRNFSYTIILFKNVSFLFITLFSIDPLHLNSVVVAQDNGKILEIEIIQ